MCLKASRDQLKLAAWSDLRPFLTKLRTISDKLMAAGITTSADDYALQIAQKIPSSQQAVRTALLTSSHLTSIAAIESFLFNLVDVDSIAETPIETTALNTFTQPKGNPRMMTCFYCGKRGHGKRECRSYARDKRNNTLHNDRAGNKRPNSNHGRTAQSDTFAFIAVTEDVPTTDTLANHTSSLPARLQDALIPDSGATDHILCQRNLFTTLQPLQTPKTITASNGEHITATEHGDATCRVKVNGEEKLFTLKNAIYAPDLQANLLSLSRLDEAGGSVAILNKKLTICNKSGSTLAIGILSDRLYPIHLIPQQ